MYFVVLGGIKAVLIDRLMQNDKGEDSAPTRSSKTAKKKNERQDDESCDVSGEYNHMTKIQLLKLCKERKLQCSGNISNLIERLESHDKIKKIV